MIKLRKRAMALEANADLLEYMLRQAQRLLGQEIENEPNGPEKWKLLWHLAYDKTKKDLVKRGVWMLASTSTARAGGGEGLARP